jgi:hypothetical protein
LERTVGQPASWADPSFDGHGKNSDKGQYFMVLILLFAIPLTVHTLDLLALKQITNVQDGTAEADSWVTDTLYGSMQTRRW